MKLNQVHDLLINAGIKADISDFNAFQLWCGSYYAWFALATVISGIVVMYTVKSKRMKLSWMQALFTAHIALSIFAVAAVWAGVGTYNCLMYQEVANTNEPDDEYLVIEDDKKIVVIKNGVNASQVTQDYIRFEVTGETFTEFNKPQQ